MATIHILCPLLLKLPGSIQLAGHTLMSTGLILQTTFSYYTGGFHSNMIIWFGILPLLGGVILGRSGVVIWTLLTMITALTFLLIDVYGAPLPTYIDNKGWFFAQGLIIFGLIIISTVLIYVLILATEKNQLEQDQKNQKILTLVRVLCHDISNPLLTIKSRVKLIKKDIEDEKNQYEMSRLDRPMMAIQEIIEKVRNWESIESGKQRLTIRPVSVGETIQYIQDIFDEKLSEKDIKLNINAPERDLMILGNQTTLQSQILSNLISNAIKFSDKGSMIDIIVKDEGKNVLTAIVDRGLGIPSSILNDIFDVTKTTTRPGTNGERGTGFGLPIVKSYVERFGGTIRVSSKAREDFMEESGTIFELRFEKASV
jgi:signal transduction histidine kinase